MIWKDVFLFRTVDTIQWNENDAQWLCKKISNSIQSSANEWISQSSTSKAFLLLSNYSYFAGSSVLYSNQYSPERVSIDSYEIRKWCDSLLPFRECHIRRTISLKTADDGKTIRITPQTSTSSMIVFLSICSSALFSNKFSRKNCNKKMPIHPSNNRLNPRRFKWPHVRPHRLNVKWKPPSSNVRPRLSNPLP